MPTCKGEELFGLEPTFLAQLKKYNILYDQTKDGFFLQAYTKSFANYSCRNITTITLNFTFLLNGFSITQT